MISKHFVDNIFKWALIHSILQLNGFIYFYRIRISLFIMNHLFHTGQCFYVLQCNSNNPIKNQICVYTQLTD